MMANHGVTTVAPTIAEAFDAMYHLERAARYHGAGLFDRPAAQCDER